MWTFLAFVVGGVIGLVVGAKWRQRVFAAEKALEEETARLVQAAKKRYKKAKEPENPAP